MSDDRTLLGYQQIEAKGQTLDTETLKQLRQLAEGGYPAAQNDLGWVYQNGRGVPHVGQMTERQLSGIEKLPNKVMP